MGSCQFTGWRVDQNMWNQNEAGPQTLYAYSGTHWYIISNQPALASNPGSVKGYPNTNYQGGGLGKAPSQYASITGTYSDAAPTDAQWNASWDIWMHDGTEVMITTAWNKVPPADTSHVYTASDGSRWYAFRYGSGMLIMQRATNSMSGTVDLKAMYAYFVAQGWLSPTVAIDDVGYGFEVHETNGPERFDMLNYNFTLQ